MGLFTDWFSKKPLNVNQMILRTNYKRRQKAKDMQVSLKDRSYYLKQLSLAQHIIGFFRKKKVNTVFLLAEFEVLNLTNHRKKKVYIDIPYSRLMTEKKVKESNMKVYCSCEDFKYRFAYWLNQDKNCIRDTAIDEHLGIALTQKPVITSEAMFCKHIIGVVEYIPRLHL